MMRYLKSGRSLLNGGMCFLFTFAILIASFISTARASNGFTALPRGLALTPPITSGQVKSRNIDPNARFVLDQAEQAYKNLKSATLSGDFSVTVKSGGGSFSVVRPFASSFQGPNKFKHQMKPNVLLGCDGKSGYAFDARENAYLRFNYSKKQSRIQMPAGVLSTLLLENPSLLFALSDVRIAEALEGFGDVKRISNCMVGGTNCPSVQFGNERDPQMIQISFDPSTHLIRQFVLNVKSAMIEGESRMAGTASILVSYTTLSSQTYFPTEHFAWTPPAGATDVLEAAGSDNKQHAF